MRVVGETDIPLAVDVETFKRSVHLGPNDTEDDLLLTTYLGAAQAVVETAIRRPLSRRQVMFSVPLSASRCWWFPVAPVSGIDAVQIRQSGGDWQAVDIAQAELWCALDEPRLGFRSGALAGASEIRVTATVGHDGDAPKQAVQAIILMVQEWWRAGISVEGDLLEAKMSFGAAQLIRQVRYLRPLEGF
ncbi:hypothetical protein [Thioclava sp. GXIMD4215]|uniref:hypothetical protein n=1 Tax=Thioclava sp. GXIMD4215 TaxID=3131928 RepID=UPI003254D122